MEPSGVLYLVSTPIGNLEDITLRALRVLKEADLIAAEDTRTTKILLDHYQIRTPLVSCYAQNEKRRAGLILEKLGKGSSVALVSDSGTPGVSDPGEQVTRAVLGAGFRVVPVPGPSAVIASLSASGLETGHFVFAGFLPRRPKAMKDKIREWAGQDATLIFYESPRRILGTLKTLKEVLGDRQAVVAREVTKKFEEFLRGSLSEITGILSARAEVKGEIAILVQGQGSNSPTKTHETGLAEIFGSLRHKGMTRTQAVLAAKKATGLKRQDLYLESLKYF